MSSQVKDKFDSYSFYLMFHQNVSQVSIFSFMKFVIYLFLTALGLRCWVQTWPVAVSGGYSLLWWLASH